MGDRRGVGGAALEACVLQHGLAGVGYVLGAEDDITGIDLDGCRDKVTGVLEP